MTYREFLRKLRATPRTWRTDPYGSIRTTQDRCPLEVVAGVSKHSISRALLVLASPPSWVNRVMWAADNPNRAPVTRKDLLRATGLKEAK